MQERASHPNVFMPTSSQRDTKKSSTASREQAGRKAGPKTLPCVAKPSIPVYLLVTLNQ